MLPARKAEDLTAIPFRNLLHCFRDPCSGAEIGILYVRGVAAGGGFALSNRRPQQTRNFSFLLTFNRAREHDLRRRKASDLAHRPQRMPHCYCDCLNYRCDLLRDGWLIMHCIPAFKCEVREALAAGRTFPDQKGIEPCQKWSAVIEGATLNLRRMVATKVKDMSAVHASTLADETRVHA